MDLTIEIVTIGNDENENLRWEGHSSRMNKGPVFSNILICGTALVKFGQDTKFRGIMN